MSIHPSLRASEKGKKQKSVLKRTERLKTMMDKGDWKEGDDIFGLPKIKTVKIRIKKEKAVKEAATTEAGAAEAPKAAGAAKAPEKK